VLRHAPVSGSAAPHHLHCAGDCGAKRIWSEASGSGGGSGGSDGASASAHERRRSEY
jgi:hypothetical protein